MPELKFWEQLVVSVTQGLVAAGVLVLAGSKYFRRQEEIRREESARVELAKLRQSAITEAAQAIGDQAYAKLRTFGMSGEHGAEKAERDSYEAYLRAFQSIVSKQHLLPDGIGEVLLEANHAITEIGTGEEVNGPLHRVAAALEQYLPELPTRRAIVAKEPAVQWHAAAAGAIGMLFLYFLLSLLGR